MTQKTLDISTKKPDLDGFITVRFIGDNGVEKVVENLDVAQVQDAIFTSLKDDEKAGIPFFRGVRRFVYMTYGINISVPAAKIFYEGLEQYMEELSDFFSLTPGSLDSTGSTTGDSQKAPYESSTVSSNESPPMNQSSESSTTDTVVPNQDSQT